MGGLDLSTVTVGEIADMANANGFDPCELLAGVLARRQESLDIAHSLFTVNTEDFQNCLEVA